MAEKLASLRKKGGGSGSGGLTISSLSLTAGGTNLGNNPAASGGGTSTITFNTENYKKMDIGTVTTSTQGYTSISATSSVGTITQNTSYDISALDTVTITCTGECNNTSSSSRISRNASITISDIVFS